MLGRTICLFNICAYLGKPLRSSAVHLTLRFGQSRDSGEVFNLPGAIEGDETGGQAISDHDPTV